jgi:hypothetical protein
MIDPSLVLEEFRRIFSSVDEEIPQLATATAESAAARTQQLGAEKEYWWSFLIDLEVESLAGGRNIAARDEVKAAVLRKIAAKDRERRQLPAPVPEAASDLAALPAQLEYWMAFLAEAEQAHRPGPGGPGQRALLDSIRRKVAVKKFELELAAIAGSSPGQAETRRQAPPLNEARQREVSALRKYEGELWQSVREAKERGEWKAVGSARSMLREVQKKLRTMVPPDDPETPATPIPEIQAIRSYVPSLARLPEWRKAEYYETTGIYQPLGDRDRAELGPVEQLTMHIYEPSFYRDLYFVEITSGQGESAKRRAYFQNAGEETIQPVGADAGFVYSLNGDGKLSLDQGNVDEYLAFVLLLVAGKWSSNGIPTAQRGESIVVTPSGEHFTAQCQVLISGDPYTVVVAVGAPGDIPGAIEPREIRPASGWVE